MLVYVFQLLPSYSKNRHTLILKTVLGLTDPLTFSIFTPPATAMVCALKEWLNTDEAYKLLILNEFVFGKIGEVDELREKVLWKTAKPERHQETKLFVYRC